METEVIQRHGTFSSSGMWKLMTNDRSGKAFGDRGKKYIKQVKHERKLGRPINPERESRPTSWGKFMEKIVFDMVLGLEYSLVSDERLVHPEFSYWTGAPDLLKGEDTVSDAKCPYSLEVFCDKIESLETITDYKEMFPEDYWQHVSNSILTCRNYAEAIIYVPEQKDLMKIRELASNYKGDQNKVAWIGFATDDELPYLVEGSKFEPLNKIRFLVPQSDKDALTARVKIAGELLETVKVEA